MCYASLESLTSYQLGYLLSTKEEDLCEKKLHQSAQLILLLFCFDILSILLYYPIVHLQLCFPCWTFKNISHSNVSRLLNALLSKTQAGLAATLLRSRLTLLRYFKVQCTKLSNGLHNLNTKEVVKTRFQGCWDQVPDLLRGDREKVKRQKIQNCIPHLCPSLLITHDFFFHNSCLH